MRRFITLLAGLALMSGSASAQESGDAGLVMGYPASIGALWHATDRIAVRPALTLRGAATEIGEDDIELESEHWMLGLSVAGLFYISENDRLRTYVAPAFSYARLNVSTESSGDAIPVDAVLPAIDRDQDQYGVSGSFGAEYAVGDRFSVFGEVGLEYNWSSQSSDDGRFLSEIKGHDWGTRSAVGVVLYF